jgi:hypothetical protein
MDRDELRKMLKDHGLSETALNKISPEAEAEMINEIPLIGKYRIVAEVVRAKYCGSGMRPGMRFVLDDDLLNVEESTAPMCLGALGPLYEKALILYDRMAKGDNPIRLHMYGYRCMDPGLDLDGLGTTEFKVWVEKR